MNNDSSLDPQARRVLAAIEVGHQLGGHRLAREEVDRVRRILAGNLSPEAARVEMRAALRALVDNDRSQPPTP